MKISLRACSAGRGVIPRGSNPVRESWVDPLGVAQSLWEFNHFGGLITASKSKGAARGRPRQALPIPAQVGVHAPAAPVPAASLPIPTRAGIPVKRRRPSLLGRASRPSRHCPGGPS
jgi:hypothetical protein